MKAGQTDKHALKYCQADIYALADPPPFPPLAHTVDVVFTFLYTAELIVNFYSNYWLPFFTSGWCWFGMCV